MQKKKQKGFTLIELLIVIGIIAILAAAVIIAINPGQQFKQARNATRWSHMNSVANAIYSYVISSGGSYPPCVETVNGVTPSPALGNLTAFQTVTASRDLIHCETNLEDHIGDLPQDPQVGGGALSTGYKVTFDGVSIKIMSGATEAQTEGVELIQ